MSFENIWKVVDKLHLLPDTAIREIPSILKDDTKKVLSTKTVHEVFGIIESAIDEVNKGSVKSIDELVRLQL